MILISVLIVLSFVGQKPEQLVPSAPDPVVVTAVSSAPRMVTEILIIIIVIIIVIGLVTPLRM